MNPNYYTYSNLEYECKLCGWKGLGKETILGEGFAELFELLICFKQVDFA